MTKQPIRSLEEALDRCKKLGMRISYQRQLILELLWRSQEHLSAREIYHRLNRQGENIALTSIYQNLAILSKQGIIECLERSPENLYSSFTDSHSHVNCLNSDRIINVWVELPASLVEAVERQVNAKVIDYRIEFYARCC
jgi:Fur family ferric uptake transcriptional regulator